MRYVRDGGKIALSRYRVILCMLYSVGVHSDLSGDKGKENYILCEEEIRMFCDISLRVALDVRRRRDVADSIFAERESVLFRGPSAFSMYGGRLLCSRAF